MLIGAALAVHGAADLPPQRAGDGDQRRRRSRSRSRSRSFVMSRLGQTFNLMTLGAMAIAIGLVIDDAIVITENIVRHVRLTPDRQVAVRAAMKELIWPVTTSTSHGRRVPAARPLTGVVGQFFTALSITLSDRRDRVARAGPHADPGARRVVARRMNTRTRTRDASGSWQSRAHSTGLPIDTSARSALRCTIPASCSEGRSRCLFVGFFVKRVVGSGFLPEMDEGAFVVDYFTPGGTPLAESDRQIQIVERILASEPEVAGTSRRLGAELGLFATEQNRGDIAVRLKEPGDRSRSSQEVIDDARPKINRAVPRMRVEFVQILRTSSTIWRAQRSRSRSSCSARSSIRWSDSRQRSRRSCRRSTEWRTYTAV